MAKSDAEHDVIRAQAARIKAAGALGRSRSYVKLLDFLVACTVEGRTPKEHEIATQVFNRGADFDPSQDAMVRVYAHHLRQKLDNFYAGDGREEPVRLSIPRGEYRLVTSSAEAAAAAEETAAPRNRGMPRLAAGAAMLLLAGIVLGWMLGAATRSPAGGLPDPAVVASPAWRAVLDDSIPALVVVGDYYIFGELDEAGNVDRLVRNFSINSSKDLDEYIMYSPEPAAAYMDLDLTYLPRGTAYALRDVLRVLFTADKGVRITSMSELSAVDLRSHHIIYVGYISALDKLYDFVFAASAFTVGETYDELVERATGNVYTSEAGMPSNYRNYRDYGLFSTFEGPAGNQFMIVSGTRDAGLMQTAFAIADPAHVAEIASALPEVLDDRPPSFELLYQVAGFDRTNLDSVILHAGEIEARRNWGIGLPEAGSNGNLPAVD